MALAADAALVDLRVLRDGRELRAVLAERPLLERRHVLGPRLVITSVVVVAARDTVYVAFVGSSEAMGDSASCHNLGAKASPCLTSSS